MTQIDFYTHVDDRILFCCRLLRKIYQQNMSAIVVGGAEVLSQLSQSLWTLSAESFIAHQHIDDEWVKLHGATDPQLCSIVLSDEREHYPHHEILINLGNEPLQYFAQFDRLVEIIPQQNPEIIAAGRQRYQFYQHHGYPIKHHKMI